MYIVISKTLFNGKQKLFFSYTPPFVIDYIHYTMKHMKSQVKNRKKKEKKIYIVNLLTNFWTF
jgi:hypothetical protein